MLTNRVSRKRNFLVIITHYTSKPNKALYLCLIKHPFYISQEHGNNFNSSFTKIVFQVNKLNNYAEVDLRFCKPKAVKSFV